MLSLYGEPRHPLLSYTYTYFSTGSTSLSTSNRWVPRKNLSVTWLRLPNPGLSAWIGAEFTDRR